MLNATVEHVVKQSLLYSYVLSQPFAVYMNSYPMIQSKALLEAEDLNYGEHGEAIRVLQEKLNKLSYFNDEIDGEFDILTEYALKKFQKDQGITVTGQVDMQTRNMIIKAEKTKYLNKLVDLSESVSPGMISKDVKVVQTALHYFGYYQGEIDSIYGPLTAKAIKIAEERHDIDLTQEVSQTQLQTLHTHVDHELEEANKNQVEKEVKKASQPKVVEVKSKEEKPKEIKVEKTSTSSIINVAHSLIGTPYVWGGESRGGFDCSGFLQYVFATQNITIPRTVSDIWNFSSSVQSPSVGDLVFYETYKPGPSHAGIYIGNSKFIHAGSSNGVTIGDMNYSYWQSRYLGAKRVR
ncbi:NlpC/P60 family protein [Virgibacillus sp. DJP39]|uniref:C40 family peptidase n=1 Tax=Virgibacillus sp. DJP39 TaxID=3409790 RepID=UPI003BB5A1B3